MKLRWMQVGVLTLFVVLAGGVFSRAQALEALPRGVAAPSPADNKPTKPKMLLGKMLFFDPRLSIDGTVSCNSCHNVMASGTDNRPNSVGVKGQHGGRGAPTVWNAAWMSVQFWDGRAASLEDQAKGPILNPIEMGMPSQAFTVARIKSIPGYVEAFKRAFPGEKDPVTYDNIARAIATFERTLITYDSPFDKWKHGNKKAMSKAALAGMAKVEELGCTACHTGPNFAGPKMPVGEGFYQKFPMYPGSKYDAQYKLTEDLGRFGVTKKEEDKNVWRVPTWRNIALTAPYFHNGAVATLDEAVRVMAKTQLNQDLNDQDVSDIVAFLNALTGNVMDQPLPRLPETPGVTVVSDK